MEVRLRTLVPGTKGPRILQKLASHLIYLFLAGIKRPNYVEETISRILFGLRKGRNVCSLIN